MIRDFVVFSGTSNPGLAAAVSAELGVHPGSRTVARYPDGEVEIRLDESVRGREVLLIQATGPPVNDNLMELLTLADAAGARPRRGSRRSCRTSATPAPTSGAAVASRSPPASWPS